MQDDDIIVSDYSLQNLIFITYRHYAINIVFIICAKHDVRGNSVLIIVIRLLAEVIVAMPGCLEFLEFRMLRVQKIVDTVAKHLGGTDALALFSSGWKMQRKVRRILLTTPVSWRLFTDFLKWIL